MADQGDPRNLEPNELHVSDGEIYRFLTTYYVHQDKLSWSRTQALGLVELATLGAALSQSFSLAVPSLVAGSVNCGDYLAFD